LAVFFTFLLDVSSFLLYEPGDEVDELLNASLALLVVAGVAVLSIIEATFSSRLLNLSRPRDMARRFLFMFMRQTTPAANDKSIKMTQMPAKRPRRACLMVRADI
jgi:hypothetical protein